MAARFNIFDHAALREAHKHMAGVLPLKVAPAADYSGGLSQYALHRRAPAHSTLNALSRGIRDTTQPGTVWWTDISHMYEPDYDGNRYARVFAEEHTSYALEYDSPTTTTQSLLGQLAQLQSWVLRHVPGAALRVIRCDFGSEYVRQGHGDDMLTKALSAFCDANLGLRVIPVAPRAQAYNKAELTIQKLAGHAFMNAVRARLGGTAWSFLRRGARFAHNHRKAQGPDDPNLRTGTRNFLLTGCLNGPGVLRPTGLGGYSGREG